MKQAQGGLCQQGHGCRHETAGGLRLHPISPSHFLWPLPDLGAQDQSSDAFPLGYPPYPHPKPSSCPISQSEEWPFTKRWPAFGAKVNFPEYVISLLAAPALVREAV